MVLTCFGSEYFEISRIWWWKLTKRKRKEQSWPFVDDNDNDNDFWDSLLLAYNLLHCFKSFYNFSTIWGTRSFLLVLMKSFFILFSSYLIGINIISYCLFSCQFDIFILLFNILGNLWVEKVKVLYNSKFDIYFHHSSILYKIE